MTVNEEALVALREHFSFEDSVKGSVMLST